MFNGAWLCLEFACSWRMPNRLSTPRNRPSYPDSQTGDYDKNQHPSKNRCFSFLLCLFNEAKMKDKRTETIIWPLDRRGSAKCLKLLLLHKNNEACRGVTRNSSITYLDLANMGPSTRAQIFLLNFTCIKFDLYPASQTLRLLYQL